MTGTQNPSQNQTIPWEYDERRIEREAENMIREGASRGLGMAKEVGSAIAETFSLFIGKTEGSIQFNLGPTPDVAKTPELMEAEKKEAERKQNFLNTTASEQNDVAMTQQLREAKARKAIEVNTKLKRSNVQFEDIFTSEGELNRYTEREVARADAEPVSQQGNMIVNERNMAKAGISAINAMAEGGAGSLEQNLEVAGESPKTNLSAQAGG